MILPAADAATFLRAHDALEDARWNQQVHAYLEMFPWPPSPKP